MFKAHMATGFIANADLRREVEEADIILLHNAKLIKLLKKHARKSWIVNHSGKLRHLEKAAGVIFISEQAKQRFLKTGAKPDVATHVIPHAFHLTPTPHSKPRITKPIKFIAAGRMVKKKGFSDLIDAAIKLRARAEAFSVTIYGHGPEYEPLKAQIEAAEMTNIHLPGWTRELPAQLEDADMFCLPSHKEPFGLVLGEAMAKSLPVIAAKTDGSLQIFGDEMPHERGGFLYEARDIDALSRHMEYALDNPDALRALGHAARGRIESDFSLDKLAANLRRLLMPLK